MPVSLVPLSSTTVPDSQYTAPCPGKSVTFQPVRVRPSKSDTQPASAFGAGFGFCEAQPASNAGKAVRSIQCIRGALVTCSITLPFQPIHHGENQHADYRHNQR